MDSTVSVSKGVFVFKNKLKSFKEVNTGPKRGRKPHNKPNLNIFSGEKWYQSYYELWKSTEKKIQKLQSEISAGIFNDVITYIANSYTGKDVMEEIPTAALLTGVNMPDHEAQFGALIRKMKENPLLHVACLHSEDGQNIKSLVENMMNQFANGTGYSSDEEEFETIKVKVKKVNYGFPGLKSWYDTQNKECLFVVIIPDFESFKEKVLHDFIQIVSSYLNVIPFAFVFGIATSLTILHKTLPYHVSSKINIQFFNSQSSTTYLNSIIENILFSEECPFHLGGNILNLFTDVFLFYDLSVNGFIQKFKYAMLEHFSFGNVMTLCSSRKKIKSIIHFDHDECENARHIMSFRKLVEKESPENQIKLLTDDNYFKEILKEEVKKNFVYMNNFHLFLKCLFVLTCDLPKNLLGKQLRELYSTATTTNITETNEYKETFQILQFQSKVELIEKITKIAEMIEYEVSSRNCLSVKFLEEVLNTIYNLLEEESIDEEEEPLNKTDEMLENKLSKLKIEAGANRSKFKHELLGLVSNKKSIDKFELQKTKLLTYISSIFKQHLLEPSKNYFFEIFFSYNSLVEQQIVGTHRAALHTALKDPFHYLQCPCCELPNEATVLKTMPDICIVYKIHLEYGKMINLYDWLQAFVSIVNPVNFDDTETDVEISPQLQARFTQAVAELEFLGFVKSSKRKTDHVQRLTWGG